MRTYITQKGDMTITTDEQTEGYALLNWMDANKQIIKGLTVVMADGGYTQLVIPTQTEKTDSDMKAAKKLKG